MWLRVRWDTVEVWLADHCCGVIDREVFQSWLWRRPAAPICVDEVEVSIDRLVDTDGRVAFTLPGVDAWTLSPVDEQRLLRCV